MLIQYEQALFTALQHGVVGKCALLCLHTLSSCVLEMQSIAARELPCIVFRVGQVSATPSLAGPVLEFLAGLVVLPHLYSHFVEQEYLGVFGIALPYTNPSKYSNYIVSLAHHVIAMWFIRCRIQYRPTVARFITQSLSTVILQHQDLMETRQRMGSMSLSSPPASTTGRPRSRTQDSGHAHPPAFSPLLTDMTEVCLDVMARYTYSNISSQPLRSPGVDFLVGGGSSKTWLVGRSLVSITTSGSGGGEQGVCGRCKAVRRSLQPDSGTTLTSNEAYLTWRRASLAGQEETVPLSLCSCWCRGWAEIMVRRPTGSVAWLMRVQNKLDIQATSLTPAQADFDWSLMSVNEPEVGKEEEEQVNEEEWGILTVDGEEFFKAETLAEAMALPKHSSSPVEQAVKNEQAASIEHTANNEQTNGFKESVGGEQSNGVGQLQLAIGNERTAEITEASGTDPISTVSEGIGETSISEHLTEKSGNKEPSNVRDQADARLENPFAFISHRQPSSHSWSEKEALPSLTRSAPRSYSLTCSSLNQLPPLFSYDEGDLLRRSPSLHTSGELSEPEQLQLLTSVSRTAMISPDADLPDHSSSTDEEQDDTDAGCENSADDTLPLADLNHSLQLTQTSSPATSPERTPVPSSLSSSSLLIPTPADTLTVTGSSSHTSAPNPSSPASHRKRVKFSHPLPRRQSAFQDHSDLYKNPAFIFLQLYHSPSLSLGGGVQDPPVLLPSSEVVERAVKVLDRIPPYNTHKIGVVYVGEGQISEHEILANTLGSLRYQQLLTGLGRLVNLRECSPDLVYLGGLDTSGTDGELACVWEDDITQVVFHVATLLPTLPNNPHCSNKKLHIGNDFVTIIYNNSGQQHSFGTIKGQFNYAEVQVDPLPRGINRVTLSMCTGLLGMLDSQPCLVSDQWLPVLVRHKALLANLASLVLLSESSSNHYPSNWLGRLRQIRHIRERCSAEQGEQSGEWQLPVPDFTTYC